MYVQFAAASAKQRPAATTLQASIGPGERPTTKVTLRLLWLDGVERKYIEEVGAMNIFFKINGTDCHSDAERQYFAGRYPCILSLISASTGVSRSKREESPLTSSLRRPVPVHLKSAGVAVPQPLSLRSAHSVTRTRVMQIKDGGIGEFSQKLYDTVTGIQTGKVEDTLGWTVEVTPLEK